MIDLDQIVEQLSAGSLSLRTKKKGYQITLFWNIGTRHETHISILVPSDQMTTDKILARFYARIN